jgi:predicted metalloprotease with PDZ domain
MRKPLLWRVLPVLVLLWLAGPAARPATAQAPEPIAYTVKFPAPDKHVAEVEATVPTGGRDAIDLMMPVWTPGFYRIENYAAKVQELSARTATGKALKVEQPKKNRWQIQTGGAPTVVVSYRLLCNSKSVTTNWVGDDLLVLNGGATFVTLVEKAKRPHDIKLELPAKWKVSMSGLEAAPGGQAHHYRARDFDTLVDSPMVAGNLDVQEFAVAGSKHFLASAGDFAAWDVKQAATDVEKIVREHHRMWGELPFNRYVFLLVFRPGGGGLEHSNSTLVTTNPTAMRTPASYLSWLSLVSHEYFHAFNVKRLRPVELGPFDYEKEARTSGLWVSEGLTTYYGELIVARAGLASGKDYLGRLSGHIDQLQKSPGRLLQTLEQASLQVWTDSFSGVGTDKGKSVSYYTKGSVVGWLLDARIRKATAGKKSLDDLMKLAYQRHSGESGFTAEEFRKTAEDVAAVPLQEWFKKAIASKDELDYAEALDWFGLRFAAGDGAKAKAWRLEIREDATQAQKEHLRAWLEAVGK